MERMGNITKLQKQEVDNSITLKLLNKSCYGLDGLAANTVDALITDPPYGISYKNNSWDKDLPKKEIWDNCFNIMKPGAYAGVFSSVRLQHRITVDIEDAGFIIKDVICWATLNGMPKSRNVALDIDKELGVKSKVVGEYKYKGYVDGIKKEIFEPISEEGMKYYGAGLGLKPGYEPIIIVQKPLAKGLTVAQNILKYGTGALNLEDTRMPYADGEGKVGHNQHPKGRVAANIIRTDEFNDGYDKFFFVKRVRQNADEYNDHPTIKPVALMNHLVKLLTWEGQLVLDPFMGSGTTGVSCSELKRNFTGYEISEQYFKIAKKRMELR